jgi:hypothetical protein
MSNWKIFHEHEQILWKFCYVETMLMMWEGIHMQSLSKNFLFQTIKAAHISTVRKLAKPPHLIMRIMDCALILFQKRLDLVTGDPDRPSPRPSWSESLKVCTCTAIFYIELKRI